MRFSEVIITAAAVSTAAAFDLAALKDSLSSLIPRSLPNITLIPRKDGGKGNCPAIWTTVSSDLTAMFLSGGQCNDDARAAIRAAFHDCGTWNKAQGSTGGCDGSLVLADEAGTRDENNGLQDISAKLLALATKRSVGVADLLQFAGAHAIVTCPGGPQVTTYVGRTDSSTPAPNGLLPDVHASADSLYALFLDKGFDDVDLAALLGAHSTSKQVRFFVNESLAGEPQDSTPGIWDVKYYSETTSPKPGSFVFPSDSGLAAHAVVGKQFKGFVNNQGKWTGKFADAMTRMSLLGVPGGKNNLIDCTKALPKATNLNKRMRAASLFKSRH
ncbi:heme peroxidase [Rhizodiscina lignyota]|uniref:Peroxidase n=1 Tax=Rhizodiscina lignyota TaxID=1504668 RepID=A0A9P4M600_9PEZI|nr:heme peroxidase [Rhizodiscina lignyota]